MIERDLHGDILDIAIANPPVNAIGAGVRAGLLKAINGAQSDPRVRVIILRGSGRMFSGGADITEFSKAPVAPSLPELTATIEASAKPVVAAIHGMALGGGLEVALASHYRVASQRSKLGLPEVKLGLLPGAGGSQRLPRLVGIEAALELIVSGDPIAASRALEIGLVDVLAAEDELLAETLSYARTLSALRRTGERTVAASPGDFERFAANTARKIRGLDAPRACIEAVRAAAALPLSDGLAKERTLFSELLAGSQAAALRHAFFAERAAARIEGLPTDIEARPISKVGVIGAGTMGGGISMNFLSAGIPVTIVEMAADALERGAATIRRNYEATAAKGRLTSDQVGAAMALLCPTLDLAALGECDLIIEAVYENMDIKKDLFSRLDSIAKPGAILASNTSYLSIDEIAAATRRPHDVLGLHFFSPANVMKLVEVVRGAKTAVDVLATGMNLARRIAKVPVVSGVCYGFIGNRMLIPRQEQATALVLEGAIPEQVDRVHTAFGMPMGPFQMADLAGVDIGWHRDTSRVESLRDALCAQGRWGQKKRAGFYDYDERRQPTPSPDVERIITKFRADAGITPRSISDEEIQVRTLYTMVNEGAKILEERIAQRASDIDIVWLYGYGWPRHTGGPMYWASQIGLQKIVDGLREYAQRLNGLTLSRLLLERASDGRSLDR